MPQAPSSLAHALFAAGALVPLGLTVLGLLYVIGLTIAAGFKRKTHAH